MQYLFHFVILGSSCGDFYGQELVDVMSSSSKEPNASDYSSISLQSKVLNLLMKGGFNLAQWQIDRSFQKVLKKQKNIFPQQHHDAKSPFLQDSPTTDGEVQALELSEDNNYFVTAGM